MSKLYDKSRRISADLTEEGLRQKRFYLILTVVLFILGAASFWEFVYELCHMIGSIVSATPSMALYEFKRMFPLILTSFVYVYLQVVVFHAYTAESKEERIGIFRKHGFVTIVLGAIISLYVIVGMFTGQYEKPVEGFISPLFPLDICLGGLLFAVVGFLCIKYSKVLAKKEDCLPYIPKRHGKFARGIGRFFCLLVYLVGISSFAACLYGTYVMDWSHGYIFYNIMLWLTYACAATMVIAYRFCYVELKNEYKPKAMRKMGLSFLIINAVIFALYLLSVQIFNEAPNQNAFGILPIEFTASFNAFMPIFAATNLLSPLVALIKGFLWKEK